MKRLCSLCLTLGMLCGAAATAGAVEIKAKGTWEILSEWSNVAPLNGPNDRFATLQRLRTQVEIISSNALKGVVFFEIGDTNWGKASEGGALGTDAKNIEVRYSYVDWQVPNTDLRVRMGLQPIILPGFVASGFSPVFGHDVAGIMLSQKWSDEVGTTFFWARPFNGNFGGWNANGSQANGTPRDTPGDAMDLLSLIVPIKTDVMKVSPWGMFGFMGTKSLMGNIKGGDPATWAPRAGLYPILGSGYTFETFPFRRNTETHENAWWLGITAETNSFSPLTVAGDFAYGSVKMGKSRGMRALPTAPARSSWIVRAGMPPYARITPLIGPLPVSSRGTAAATTAIRTTVPSACLSTTRRGR